MTRVFITARFDLGVLAQLCERHDVVYESWTETGQFLPGEEVAQRLNSGKFEVYVVEGCRLRAKILEMLRYTRLVCVARGTPSNVEIEAATHLGIVVTNSPGRNAVAVAEYTVGLMLDLVRGITRSNRMVLTSTFDVRQKASYVGIELDGRTVGLVGVGRAGREVARRLRAFNVRVLGYDPYADPLVTKEAGVELVTLDYLLSVSDIVSVHAASTPETKGLMGADELALMKPTAYLVNTARGPIVDESALYEALYHGCIAGAALDVFAEEPVSRDNPLVALDRVLATPHLGGATAEVVVKHSRMIAEDIKTYASGQCPKRALNPEAWTSRQLGQ